jgi:hypothetical protein
VILISSAALRKCVAHVSCETQKPHVIAHMKCNDDRLHAHENYEWIIKPARPRTLFTLDPRAKNLLLALFMTTNSYEAQNLLGCTAVFLIECQPTFRRYVLPPSSGRLIDIQLRTRQYISEDSELHTHRRENLKSHISFCEWMNEYHMSLAVAILLTTCIWRVSVS